MRTLPIGPRCETDINRSFSSHCVYSVDVHLGSACWGRDDDREIVWLWTSVEEVPIGFQAIGTNAPALGQSISSLKARTGSCSLLHRTEQTKSSRPPSLPASHPAFQQSVRPRTLPSSPPLFTITILPLTLSPPKFPFLSLPLPPYLKFPFPSSPQRPSQSPTPSAPKSTTARSSCPAPPAASAASRH